MKGRGIDNVPEILVSSPSPRPSPVEGISANLRIEGEEEKF